MDSSDNSSPWRRFVGWVPWSDLDNVSEPLVFNYVDGSAVYCDPFSDSLVVVVLLTEPALLHSASVAWQARLDFVSVLASVLAKMCFARRWHFRLVVLRWKDSSSLQYVHTTLVLSKLPFRSFLNLNLPLSTPGSVSLLITSLLLHLQAGKYTRWRTTAGNCGRT